MSEEFPTPVANSGALFRKPYMEFEYAGEVHRLENIRGGHNGATAQACIAHPPVWDEKKERWVVPLENNIIEIDLSDQEEMISSILPGSPLGKLKIASAKSEKLTKGMLITSGEEKSKGPKFPVDCMFEVFITAKIPWRPQLRNVRPFRLLAENIEQWPPMAGTTYKNLDDVELYPAFLSFAEKVMKPIVRIPKGDETILEEVFLFDGDEKITLSKIE